MTVVLGDRFASELSELSLPWQAQPAPDPHLLVLNEPLAVELGLDVTWLGSAEGTRFLVGEAVPEGARPVAQAYAGHQFGGYSPRLGDGRALLLGELTTPDGRLRDLHLKGSGRTPFSRGGDGFAVVGPMLREHVISEAMHALGIPTTRSLAVTATGRPIEREEGMLPGAVLARVASSHLRVGSFEYVAASGDQALLRRLADVAIARHHPEAAVAERPYVALFEAVVAAQASLVARWMLVGFVHGVMNTDNMTISGETIDYGPCAFMEAYDPATVYSSIDHRGRYAYGNQPGIAQWNLARLAEALIPLFDDDQDVAIGLAQAALDIFRRDFDATWSEGIRAKLGLRHVAPEIVADLREELLPLLHRDRLDWTSFWRDLAGSVRPDLDGWTARWLALGPDTAAMGLVNPAYVPRNRLVEEALDAATAGDLVPFGLLLEAVQQPFTERVGFARFALPDEAGLAGFRTFCGT